MEPPVFYAPPENITADSIELPAAESRHALRVMRLEPPDLVMVIDGLGTAYRGEITAIGLKGSLTVRPHATLRAFGEPSVKLTLAAGLSTASRFDTLIQKGTELGVSRFVPVISDRSKVRIDSAAKAEAKVRRLEKVALAATKQCRRSYRPEILSPMSLASFLEDTDGEAANLVFHPGSPATGLEKALTVDDSTRRVSLLVGPESGFSNDEVATAVAAGFTMVSLGPRILRAETAGPVAAALVMALLGELR